ncbi:MAG: thiamine pyrophosphate-dependent dehydrogenase E1 component subunit alpha [Gemmataceae bacterium]|nr:thiamine pyrophosphate-dependent dehydrogenase E1 component subunit alpha [Gemmataceae bacterium]
MPTAFRGPTAATLAPPAELWSRDEMLPAARCRELHRLMVRCRRLEERCIKMSKSGEAYFWVGGPGEEAFNTCLGMQLRRGEGPAYDYVHLHYRNPGVLLGMGMPVLDHVRQMAMTLTDPHSMGRNFVCHYSKRDWNVIPVTSVIEVQYVMAPGTALMQKRSGGDGVTAVIGGDAGTHEGDFASCMIWSSRPGFELPVLILVTNNGWGISTASETQHAEKSIVDRGKAFGIPGEVVDGNDPIASWHALSRGFRHCRTRRKPYMIEARVSRLHGHSSSSGAARVPDEDDCVAMFEKKLLDRELMTKEEIERVHTEAINEIEEAVRQVHTEPRPTAADVYTHTYAPSPVDSVYPEDYTGLPA